MLKEITVMMIDDDPAAHIYHKIMMEEAGLSTENVLEFYDVDSGLEYLKGYSDPQNEKQIPDLVLVDLNIPKKSGWEFIEELKHMQLGNQLPKVYIVSNTQNPEDKQRAAEIDEVIGLKAKFLTKEFFENF